MFVLSGEGVSAGIAFGKVYFYHRQQRVVQKNKIFDIQEEIKRFAEAREVARGELQVLYERSVSKMGQQNAFVFGVHQMLLDDVEFVEEVCRIMQEEQTNAEYAIEIISAQKEEDLRRQKRYDDLRDVVERLLRILRNDEKTTQIEEGSIIVAENLLPSEIMQLSEQRIAGIVLMQGNANSHAAIFSKSMEIPMVIQTKGDWNESYIGQQAILDGKEGKIYLSPEESLIQEMMERQRCETKRLGNIKTKLKIGANIGSIEEAKKAVLYGADKIGLVRSEMFCLNEGRILAEEEQVHIYRKLMEIVEGAEIVIRTWDFGEDKQLKDEAIKNRGMQWCIDNETIFKTQLRAICKASIYGKVAILFPMIYTTYDVKYAKQMLEDVKKELFDAGIPYEQDIKIGVMLETPAAIINSRELAKQVDFCSIGTNDLIQYTFGLQRGQTNEKELYEECYSTLIDMLRTATTNVHAEGKNIGICGEMGADIDWIEKFIKIGIDELSMVPSVIVNVREQVEKIEKGLS